MNDDEKTDPGPQTEASAPIPGSGIPLTSSLTDRLENDFTYHPPKGDQEARHAAIRGNGLGFAHEILQHTPESREQSLALTKLEECIFWANAAIARNE